MAADQLPSKMGKKYTSVVVACLKALDSEEEGNEIREGADVKDPDGVEIGLRYIEHVLLKTQEIVV